MYDYKEVIVKVIIDGKIYKIDLASKKIDGYNDCLGLRNKIKYLGRGKYYSYNSVKAKDPDYYHFWVKCDILEERKLKLKKINK